MTAPSRGSGYSEPGTIAARETETSGWPPAADRSADVAAPAPDVSPDPPAPPAPGADKPMAALYRRFRRLSLGVKILIFMAIGVAAGIIFPEASQGVAPLGDLFIRLLMMAAIPLVFFNLIAGIASLSDIRTLGRLGAKIMAWYLFTTAVALSLGMTTMNLLRPGVGMTLQGEVADEFGNVPAVTEVLLDLVPNNVFAAFSEGKVAQIVVFAVLLGIATMFLPGRQRQGLQKGFTVVADLLRKLVDLIMYYGPIGIGALAAATVGQHGSQIFGPLAVFISGVWFTQGLMVVVYMTAMVLLAHSSPFTFLRRTGELYATAAATCSSLASLAVAFDVAEKKLRLPHSVYSFTLPLGAQLNKDGTSIMLAAVLLFTAQAAGVQFDLSSQLTILLVGLILSEGSGGIPGGGLVIALIFVQAFQLPLEIAVIVGGIYRLIDMGSTTINVMGDVVGTAIVARSEGHVLRFGDQP